ncbi:hypothetical protein ACOMHN_051688 [Nucella lapillus]
MESEGCPVGTLIDLSEPIPCETEDIQDSQGENKENCVPVTEAIEVTRKTTSQTECRLDIVDSLKEDIIIDRHKAGLRPQNSLSDVALIEDEVFDFDLPLSPESTAAREKQEEKAAKTNGNDEEVFFGPMGFTEKCIAAGVAEEAIQPLSPLRPDQMAELAKEAYSVACRISMMRSNSQSSTSSVSTSPTKLATMSVLPCRRKLTCEDLQSSQTSSQSSEADGKNSSPRKKRHYSQTLGKEEGSLDCGIVSNREGKKRERKSTFTKEEPVESLMSLLGARSGEKKTGVGSGALSREKEQKKSVVSGARSGEKKTNTGIGARSGEKDQRKSLGSGVAKNRQSGSRLQPPSKLRRYNNSQPNLARPKPAAAEEGSDSQEGGGEAKSTAPSVTRKSLQLPRASGLSSGRASKLALPSSKSTAAATAAAAAAGGQPQSGEESRGGDTAAGKGRKTSGIPKGPATKPQLMQPGLLQRRAFATAGRSSKDTPTVAASTGPLKASAHVKPTLGDTVERPYNPALAAAAAAAEGRNSQCPETPATHKRVVPRVVPQSSEASTPAKSSCSSSSMCGSTPGSVKKRMSLLPMSAKRRSGAGSLPPPSPMSLASSSSSVSRRSVVSSSDASDSPVFDPKLASRLVKSRLASGTKPRKPLVQNTPDLPKRSLSRWSPVRKPKAMPLEDQVSMCTKRVSPTDH